MKLDTEFIKLPLRFDAERLADEVAGFFEDEWKPHPQGYPGNSAVSLIAAGGDPLNDATKGPMLPTPSLPRCRYLRQVLAAFQSTIGRTRLMRIVGDGEVTSHVDSNYYWLQRVRIHVPMVTYPEVQFTCGDKSLNMAAGECWLFDTWRLHSVRNHVPHPRIHLVVDTVGSAAFWDMVAVGERPFAPQRPDEVANARFVPFEPDKKVKLETERVNHPVVMSPWEQEILLAGFLDELTANEENDSKQMERLFATVRRFQREWRDLWARFAIDSTGWDAYRRALDELEQELKQFPDELVLTNGLAATQFLRQAIVRPALNSDVASTAPAAGGDGRFGKLHVEKSAPGIARSDSVPSSADRFDRPIFIVGAPRSGSTLLFETLARSPSVWTVGGESHGIFERIAQLTPAERGYDSNRLTETDADQATVRALRANFLAHLKDRDGAPLAANGPPFRMLEKTPKNALRIPFLKAVFPSALFVYLFRPPGPNLSSIVEAWRSARFVTYPDLPDWPGPPWSLLLIEGWQELRGKALPEIAAAQYESVHRQIMEDLSRIPKEHWCAVSYAALLADPQSVAQRLCRFAGIDWDQQLEAGRLPLSRHTLTPPDPNKWRKNAELLASVLPRARETARRVRQRTGLTRPEPLVPDVSARMVDVPDSMIAAVARQSLYAESKNLKTAGAPADIKEPTMAAAPAEQVTSNETRPKPAEPRCVNTNSFPQLLAQLGISLLVTTYQAGKLFMVRSNGGKLNAHFRDFHMPMGLACHHRRLVIGTKLHVWEFRNQPDVCRSLDPPGLHDACFLPRSCHVTGDIRIHELAIANRELWIVNTRFSCLCTLDQEHSFVPRWRPPFVTALAPEDRCHLNGLAIHDGRPKYVTALGTTDTEGGWRENKAGGGCLIDVDSGEILIDGLSMPHSPRWYNDELWVLESGDGNISRVDLQNRRCATIAQVPGFTRGIDFCGPFAFVGLSQVRESAVFSGIPITERLEERTCGIWVIDLRNGKTVAFLRFEAGVQEIFAVQVLPNTRFPELINDDQTYLANSFMLPQEALADVPQLQRSK